MGNGNSSGTLGGTRGTPNRLSQAKLISQEEENIQQARTEVDEIIAMKEKSFTNLKNSFTQHEDKLARYNDRIQDTLEGLKNKGISEVKRRDVSDSQAFRETIDCFVHEFQCVQKSFKECKQNVFDYIEVLEDNIKVVGDMNKKLENASLRKKNKRRRTKKAKLKEKFVSATVQIFYTQEGALMKEIQTGLTTTLTNKLADVNLISLNDISKVDDNMLLIITCIVSTRVEADATCAMKNIKNPANAVLLLIHVGEAHAFTTTSSSSHLTGKKFRNLRGIYDMFFVKNNGGFFRCDMNDKSVNELCSFCKEDPSFANIFSTKF